MIRAILCFVLLLAGLGGGGVQDAAAQGTRDFKIRVVSAGQPVGYAYVLINDSYHAMADPDGYSSIPASRLRPGDTLSARFVGMQSVPLAWDGKVPGGSTITLELIPGAIESVVVTATARDRSRQLFRRHVRRMPTHEWYTGFRGDYDLLFGGDYDLPYNSAKRWRAYGTFERNHLPGDDVNSLGSNTFTLTPDPGSSPVPTWQIQRHILLVRGIAERAVQLDAADAANHGMIIKYRGQDDGQNVFLVIKPYFDRVQGTDDSFQTIVHVSATSGIVLSSETVSRTKWGIWNVAANYAVHDNLFIYPVTITGNYQEKNPSSEGVVTVDAVVNNNEVYSIAHETISQIQLQKNLEIPH
ncbi:MAG: hypothetical protein LBR57_02445 [Alistipes sp.]|jgi:hypothetical protein|nr:hypothetical protein [Alistipes sp.]